MNKKRVCTSFVPWLVWALVAPWLGFGCLPELGDDSGGPGYDVRDACENACYCIEVSQGPAASDCVSRCIESAAGIDQDCIDCAATAGCGSSSNMFDGDCGHVCGFGQGCSGCDPYCTDCNVYIGPPDI